MFGSITGQKNIEKDTIFIVHTRENLAYFFFLLFINFFGGEGGGFG